MTSERMYIEELKKELPWRDIRSIEKFCRTYHIRLFSFRGTKIRFVLRDEFEKQMEKIYDSHPLDKDSKITPLRKRSKNKIQKGSGYRPQGEYEKAYLSTLQSLINK
jgi:hypothetical protein